MAESFRRSLRAPVEAESRLTPKYSDARALSANSARGYGLNSEPAQGQAEGSREGGLLRRLWRATPSGLDRNRN